MTAPTLDDLVADLLTSQWVIDLFGELAARQPGSTGLADRLRPRDASNHAFWPFHAPLFPLAVREAHGCRLTDLDGRSYLDCHLGFGAQALHGHSPAPVVEYVRERMAASPGNGYLHPVEWELVSLLEELVPHRAAWAFLNSGTEATLAAIRLARAYTGRRLVAKFEGALHGVHDLAAHNTAFWYHGHPRTPFPDIGPDGVVPTPALTGVPAAGPDELLVLPYDAAAARALLERHRHDLACVLAEPVTSAYPFEEACVPVVREVAEACRALRVPFVLDEVLTGFRYGAGGAAARFDIPADLICYGKVLSGLGLPLSAVAGRTDILDGMRTSGVALTDFGAKTCVQTSHAGNHLALCASLASLRLLAEQGDGYYAATRARVGRLRDGLAAFRAEHGIPLRLLGFGDFIGSFAFLAGDSYPGYREFAAALNPVGMMLLALLLRRRGVYALSLPMLFTGGAHGEEDLAELLDAVRDSALELAGHGFPFVLDGAEGAR